MLVVPSGYGNFRDPIRFCAAAHCELILLVGDAAASAELIAGDIDGPQVVPFTRDLQQALDALAHLQWQPDTIVLWDAKPGDAVVATMAARLRDPAGESCDLVLKTGDLRSLEPLNVALQEYADIVLVVDGAVLISSRARSARRQCQ